MAGAETESSVGKRLREALRFVREGSQATGEAFTQQVEAAHRALAGATGEMVEIPLAVATNRITLNEETVYRSESQDANLAFDLFKQGLRRITFRAGITVAEVSAFMRALAECRDATSSDVDFVGTLWQEELEHIRYVAIDGFTEKIFMSEEAFTRRFRAAIDDLVPGLTELEEEDTGDRKRRQYEALDDFDAVESAVRVEHELGSALGRTAPALLPRFRAGLGVEGLDHLVRLHASVMVKDPQPLDDRWLGEVTTRLLEGYLEEKAWEGFAAAARSLWRLVEARNGFRPAVTARLEALRPAVAGGPVVALCARHIVEAPRTFARWVRWYFVEAGVLQAPEILAAINQAETPQATEFLKDLLHRQGTASLEPWAARLRDPNPGVVLEVLEVILQSPLGAQARPLLIECLRNADGAVRARAVAGLARDYDLKVREVLLPLLKDEAADVRKEVLHRFVQAGDRSVAPYLANCIKAGGFGGFDEDEQRMYFEGLARLGGARFHDVFKEKLRLDGEGNTFSRLLRRGPATLGDDPVRRGAVSGLALLGTPEARALIQEVRDRAENTLASHCEVVLRMATRDGFQSPQDARLTRTEPLEDVAAGKDLMGSRLIFEPADVLVPPPNRPRPTGADEDAPAPVATPTRPASTYVVDESIPLAQRPLLGRGEVFDEADVRELVASPPISEGKRFRLTSPRAALVGIALTPQAAPVQAALPARPVSEVHTPAAGLEIAGLERRREADRARVEAETTPRLPPGAPAERPSRGGTELPSRPGVGEAPSRAGERASRAGDEPATRPGVGDHPSRPGELDERPTRPAPLEGLDPFDDRPTRPSRRMDEELDSRPTRREAMAWPGEDERPTRPSSRPVFESIDEHPTRPAGRADADRADVSARPESTSRPSGEAVGSDDRPSVQHTHERTVIRSPIRPAGGTPPSHRGAGGIEALLRGYLDSAPPRPLRPALDSDPPVAEPPPASRAPEAGPAGPISRPPGAPPAGPAPSAEPISQAPGGATSRAPGTEPLIAAEPISLAPGGPTSRAPGVGPSSLPPADPISRGPGGPASRAPGAPPAGPPPLPPLEPVSRAPGGPTSRAPGSPAGPPPLPPLEPVSRAPGGPASRAPGSSPAGPPPLPPSEPVSRAPASALGATPPAAPVAPPAEGEPAPPEGKKKNLDALLKGFLDLDLGD